jgi:hypothetical protein
MAADTTPTILENFSTVTLTFIFLPLLLVAALVAGVIAASRRLGEPDVVRRRDVVVTIAASAVWMGATWAAADAGILRDWDAMPPPMVFLVAGIVGLAGAIAFTGYGRRLVRGLPLWTLVAVQAFRLPLEIAMHMQYERGVMPEQMSYAGRNFDIVTGMTAIVVAWLAASGRAGRGVVLAWNILGFALLLNIVVVSILSTPVFRYFGDDRLNVWVTYPPFVWLPAVMVLCALAGHLLIFRAVLRR